MDQAERLRIIKASQHSRPLARVITVTSGKGGVGKSNTAINLAIQFRKMEKRVIILDADFGLANIEIMFGAVPKHNLCDLIYQGKNIREIITWGSITDSYSLLKALYRHPRFTQETTKVKMIANRVEKEEEGEVLFSKLNAVVARYLKVPMTYLGCVPEDAHLSRAVMQQVPVSLQNPGARSTAAYERIAQRLLGREEEERQPKRGMAAFFSHIVTGKK